MSPRMEKALIALSAAAVPLLAAATGWVQAHTEKEKKLDLADNYRGYIEEQMIRDERLEKALGKCMELLHGDQ